MNDPIPPIPVFKVALSSSFEMGVIVSAMTIFGAFQKFGSSNRLDQPLDADVGRLESTSLFVTCLARFTVTHICAAGAPLLNSDHPYSDDISVSQSD